MNAKTYCLFLALSFLFFQCEREKVNYLGPEYYSAGPDFHILDYTIPGTYQITGTPDTIKASFSSRVSYVLTLKGKTSGAYKTIRGIGENVLQHWDGGHDGDYYFMEGEAVEATLSFLGTSLEGKKIVTLGSSKQYLIPGKIFPVATSSAPVKEGFEGTYNFNSPTWSYGPYSDAGEQLFSGIDGMNPSNGIRPIHESKAYTLSGQDLNHNYFVCGLKKVFSPTEKNYFASGTPVYVNIYLYGKGNPASKLNVTFEENDRNTADNSSSSNEDAYDYQFSLAHTGWKLFTVRYADFTLSGDPSRSNYNGIKEPDKIVAMAFNLLSSPSGQAVDATFDMPVISFGEPFDPTK